MSAPGESPEELTVQYRELEENISKLAEARQQFVGQLNENDLVRQELDLLEDDAEVFKQIGPVLVKQDISEAKAHVKQRLDRIQGELQKIETNVKAADASKDTIRDKLIKFQEADQAKKQKAEQIEE